VKRYLVQVFILVTVWIDIVEATEVKGVVVICDLGPKSPVSMLDVRVFGAAKVPHLLASIKSLESSHTGGEKESTKRLDSMMRIF
jgi:hypothetical protein